MTPNSYPFSVNVGDILDKKLIYCVSLQKKTRAPSLEKRKTVDISTKEMDLLIAHFKELDSKNPIKPVRPGE